MSDEHKMIREEAVQYDRGEKTLTLGPYRLPGEAREVALRPELEGMNPRVVVRYVSRWEEL